MCLTVIHGNKTNHVIDQKKTKEKQKENKENLHNS